MEWNPPESASFVNQKSKAITLHCVNRRKKDIKD
jgi:hypothetical protein